jgi:ribA/ribD-fused uncharacterized protein
MSKAKARAKQIQEKDKGIVLFNDYRAGNNHQFSQWFTNLRFTFKVTLLDDNGHRKKGSILTFYNAVQYMMYNKAILFGDWATANQIIACRNPKLIISYGRNVGKKNDTWDQEVWDEEKFKIVVDGNFLKFSQNPVLKKLLLSTSNSYIAEASNIDNIWGIGISENHIDAKDHTKWNEYGQNLLGKALMEVRFRIRKSSDPTNVDIKRVVYTDLEMDSADTIKEIKRQEVIAKLGHKYHINPDDI